MSIINRSSKDILHKYMLGNFLISYNSHLLPNELNSTQMKCARYIAKHMTLPIGKLYIDNYFNDHAQHEVILFMI